MASLAPENNYEITHNLSDPFTAISKAEKQAKLDAIKKDKEDAKKFAEDQKTKQRESAREEERIKKSAALMAKNRSYNAQLDSQIAKETVQKEKEKENAKALKAKEDADKSATALKELKLKESMDNLAEQNAQDALKARNKLIASEKQAKAAMLESTNQAARDEAEIRAVNGQANMVLQKKIEAAQKAGKFPSNFIPMVWGASAAARQEMEDLLDKPYWDEESGLGYKKTIFVRPEGQFTKTLKSGHKVDAYQPGSMSSPDVIHRLGLGDDSWLQEKWMTQGSTPWSASHQQNIQDPSNDMTALAMRTFLPKSAVTSEVSEAKAGKAIWEEINIKNQGAGVPTPGTASEVVQLVKLLAANPETAYGKKSEIIPKSLYGQKQLAETFYGQKPRPISDTPYYGTKISSDEGLVSPYGKRTTTANHYGKISMNAATEEPNERLVDASTFAKQNVYGMKDTSKSNLYGSKLTAAAGETNSTGIPGYGTKPTNASGTSVSGYGTKPTSASGTSASGYGTKPTTGLAGYGTKPTTGFPGYGTKPTVAATGTTDPKEISEDQLLTMVAAMTVAQQQQAKFMLSSHVEKGNQLTVQQEQLLRHLNNLPEPDSQFDNVPQPADANDGISRKGLFFTLPGNEKFVFGIPGREMITLRQFDKVQSDEPGAESTKALLVICNDVAFVCQPKGGDTGSYELYEAPVQRDRVKASKSSINPFIFHVHLGVSTHRLVATVAEEALYWVQTLNERENFTPTDSLST